MESNYPSEKAWCDALAMARSHYRALLERAGTREIETQRRTIARIRAKGLPEWQDRDHGRDDWPRLP